MNERCCTLKKLIKNFVFISVWFFNNSVNFILSNLSHLRQHGKFWIQKFRLSTDPVTLDLKAHRFGSQFKKNLLRLHKTLRRIRSIMTENVPKTPLLLALPFTYAISMFPFLPCLKKRCDAIKWRMWVKFRYKYCIWLKFCIIF